MDMYMVVLIFTISLLNGIFAQLSKNPDELLNWCLKSENHKHYPGKEDALHDQCRPWRSHACCTSELSRALHAEDMYNFTLDACREVVGRNMSTACREFFTRDNCFYECEPHIGLWVVSVKRKFASERFYKVPLCASDCDAWFEACKDDYTCAYNWPRDFNFKQGRNICPEGSQCSTFHDIYRTPKDFCENVWDHSWSYTPDEQACFRMWFDDPTDYANRRVAEYYIRQRFNASGRVVVYKLLAFFAVLITLLAY